MENKDAKTLQELNYKYERLIQLDYARHQEVLRQLKEIRELAKKPNPPAELPNAAATSAPASAPAQAPTVTEASSPTPAAAPVTIAAPAADKPVEAVPTAATPPVATASVDEKPTSEPVAGTSTPVTASVSPEKEVIGRETATEQPAAVEVTTTPAAATAPSASTSPAPAPAVEVKEVPVVIPPEVLQGIHESESYAILAIIFSVISLASMGFLIYTVRKSDERIRRMLWKSEVDHLRDEVMGGRPVLKVEKSFDRLLLTNTGTVIADDIKLSLGPAPATMKQRLRVLAKIAAGEKAEVEIGAQTENQIYGTLEYKNPENDRTYKEQFTLKIDSVTGELVPIQQAV
ncbi:MAG TPA: hypothetical protein VFX30_10635 [bacterium]|nr:hypothetical protein [bacterium]